MNIHFELLGEDGLRDIEEDAKAIRAVMETIPVATGVYP